MKIPVHGTSGSHSGVVEQFARIIRLFRILAPVLMALLAPSIENVHGQTTTSAYQVRLSWIASSSEDVTGYRIHYGTSSGTYTAKVAVGNLTSGTITGLANGVTYHFAVTAYNSAGLESGYSNEVTFKPGLLSTRISTNTNGAAILTVRGLIGSQYEIEASEDLSTWRLIDTITMPEGGLIEFSDPDAGRYPTRFYRTRKRP